MFHGFWIPWEFLVNVAVCPPGIDFLGVHGGFWQVFWHTWTMMDKKNIYWEFDSQGIWFPRTAISMMSLVHMGAWWRILVIFLSCFMVFGFLGNFSWMSGGMAVCPLARLPACLHGSAWVHVSSWHHMASHHVTWHHMRHEWDDMRWWHMMTHDDQFGHVGAWWRILVIFLSCFMVFGFLGNF